MRAFLRFRGSLVSAAFVACNVVACASHDSPSSETPLGVHASSEGQPTTPGPPWGKLANGPAAGNPVKGVYFFPGTPKTPELFTQVANNPSVDYSWGDAAARRTTVSDIGAVGANVIFGQYSGIVTSDVHFLNNTIEAFDGLWTASNEVNGPLILPALESNYVCNPECTARFDVAKDFVPPNAPTATGWIDALVGHLVEKGFLSRWAQLYDRNGAPRYAIHIAQATSDAISPGDDDTYISILDAIATQIKAKYQIAIGFTLTPIRNDTHYALVRTINGRDTVANLQSCQSCLAIAPFASEIEFIHGACDAHLPSTFRRGVIDCNTSAGDLGSAARSKKDRTKLWVQSGIPYFVDVNTGYDGHIVFNPVWKEPPNAPSTIATWGDTGYVFDKWRNSQSELKGHHGDGTHAAAGIIFNSWNGYTEGMVAPSATRPVWDPVALQKCRGTRCEKLDYPYPWNKSGGGPWASSYNFQDVKLRWLADVFSVDPHLCDHYYYENGMRRFHIFGAICEKFTEKYGEYGDLGAPRSDEYVIGSGLWHMADFESGQVHWNDRIGAHEVHGGIYAKYRELKDGGAPLGAVLTDESAMLDGRGRYNHFEGGSIYWTPQTLGHGLWGPIGERWASMHWETTPLGYPMSEPTSTVRNGYCAQFEHGSMYYSEEAPGTIRTPVSEVHGSILAEYGRLGRERSWLGFPLTDQKSSNRWCVDGQYNQFEGGYIDSCPDRPQACAHHGDGSCADGSHL